MAQSKTKQMDVAVADFLAMIEHPTRAADAQILMELFQRITGFEPKMWGPTIIGFGQYHYVYGSGREGDCNATGFSPRKAAQSIYVMPGYNDYSEILSRLGKYKMGKACLYVTKLADIDLDVLEELIRAGLRDLNAQWPVTA
jgi:hypothetical protein